MSAAVHLTVEKVAVFAAVRLSVELVAVLAAVRPTVETVAVSVAAHRIAVANIPAAHFQQQTADPGSCKEQCCGKGSA